jgi:hypothetical protein
VDTAAEDEAGSGRDRDERGRARNSRARDGLGRPLPRGRAGVPRQPEGLLRSAPETLRLGQSLLDAGSPFHAHEVFEDAWKSAPAPERELWRGLAQLAVGLTHAARGNRRGATGLLARAGDTLSEFEGQRPYGVEVDALISWCRASVDLDPGPVALTAPRITSQTGPPAA